MNAEFSRTLSLLRQEKGVSQRTAAGVLGISQALLSHYENGIREPGLAFVVKACDYYGVSADYLLGRTLTRDGTTIGTEELYDISDEKDNSMRGSVLALLSKKLLVNSIGMLFDLLGKTAAGRPSGRRRTICPPPCTRCTATCTTPTPPTIRTSSPSPAALMAAWPTPTCT